MGDINKWCPMCGAAPGEPCTIISGDPELGEKPGDVRAEPHFYRFNDAPISVAVADEPPFYVGDLKPDGGSYTQADALRWSAESRRTREADEGWMSGQRASQVMRFWLWHLKMEWRAFKADVRAVGLRRAFGFVLEARR